MKVIDLINLYIVLNLTKNANSFLPTKFAYCLHKNLTLLQKEAEFWDSISEEERKEIKDQEVDVNLFKISINDLPENMPSLNGRNAMDFISLIIFDFVKEEEPETSLLSKLIKTKEK
jgi:hypothetical protein